MMSHPIQRSIEAADRAIAAEEFDDLMTFYADDAVLVVEPGLVATGKAQIMKTFLAIADHFDHGLRLRHEDASIQETGDTALVVTDAVVEFPGLENAPVTRTRRVSYVFRKSPAGTWLCAVDNSHGAGFLGAGMLQ